ncbi:MAG: Holliday junction resolvase Hjc [Candidatus Micrarchaeota archaeon]
MAFGSYKKGSRTENELVKLFLGEGFSVIRAAGSGGGTPCPDILAFKKTEQLGFECKAVEKTCLQLRKEQVEQLKKWEDNTNITTYVAWRVKGKIWHFVRLDYLKENPKSYSITIENARKYGIGLEHLLKK